MPEKDLTTVTKKKSSSVPAKDLTVIGVMAAIICIMGPFSLPLPFSPVPVSLATLPILLSVYVLGTKKGTISLCIYLLIGLAGVPVFSSFGAGFGKLMGPTGGYLIGYLFLSVIAGLFIEHFPNKPLLCLTGMLAGTGVLYLFGTVWLAHVAGMDFMAALGAGVLPFIPGDMGKIVIIMLLGPVLRKSLIRAGILTPLP